MATFQDWYDGAVGQGGDWQAVADNARRGARYADPTDQSRFQDAVGKADPKIPGDFGSACLPHHLKGEPIAGVAFPSHWTRVVTLDFLTRSLERLGGGDGLPSSAPVIAGVREDAWVPVSQLLPTSEGAEEAMLPPARVLDESHPADRAVFATFDPDDLPPEAGQPRPRFLDRVRTDHGTWGTTADYAVHRLATDRRPLPGQPVDTKVLLHYPRERVGAPLFSVPADAMFNPLFRAITPGDPHPCGRTFPEGSNPVDHAHGACGENEVVHPNDAIPCAQVFVITLGKTSPRGTV